MYIPTTFFSSQGACIELTTSILAGSGSITSGSFVSQSITWSYVEFTNTHDNTADNLRIPFSASLTITSGSTGRAKLLVVAGGGGGGGTSCFNLGNCGAWSAAGGGAGGVVYYDNFPVTPGTFEIVVGDGGTRGNSTDGYTYNIYQTNSFSSGGLDSYFQLPNNKIYTPFTSSKITAYGGGAGEMYYSSWQGGLPYKQFSYSNNVRGGSAAGTIYEVLTTQTFDVAGQASTGIALGGLNSSNQGNSGARISGSFSAGQYLGASGGGAYDAGQLLTNGSGSSLSVGRGGDGLFLNLNGTGSAYAAGGRGVSTNGLNIYAANNGSGSWGSGGSGGINGYYTITYPSQNGTAGKIILCWPKCPPKIQPQATNFPLGAYAIYDFGNTNSYPGYGTQVYDISGNGNNGDLWSAPTFETGSGGILRFNSANSQYISYTGVFTPNTTVIGIWKNVDSSFANETSLTNALFSYGLKAQFTPARSYVPVIANKNYSFLITYPSATQTPASITTWHQYATAVSSSGTTTTATSYIDGSGSVATQSQTLDRTGTSASGSTYIGWDPSAANRYANGYLMGYLHYNRVLTTAEIQQIYLQFSSRF